ncbi:AAA family ATPase [Thermosynechococcaceae cyanobacterium BACA0444]|uniref:AAA family ATPase n=1 Tax=Pseudocalidococcus azoricus BACA0444 TaxID=2918990 RepID=A0AAE4JYL8_9CYAN|nr:AAA family ATPase [Pseudocalidococcus azoricus]MDS3862318.1 AAA family ATPase [Pseudocalidococcus azoricus BACA0444]
MEQKDYEAIFSKIDACETEADVEQKIIIPFLNRLGYTEKDWQAQPTVARIKPDFIVKPHDAQIPHFPFLVIEVKAPKVNLKHKSQQLKTYLQQTKGLFGLLTNGKQLHLFYFNPFANQHPQLVQELRESDDFTKINKLSTLLHHKAALGFIHHLYQRQQQTYAQFSKVVNRVYPTFRDQFPEIPQTKPMIITVFNNKGGVGKTTMTINLGAALAQMGKKVLLIDVDAQANLSIGLGIDPLKDVEDQGRKDITHLLLEKDTTLDQVIYKKAWKNLKLDIVPSHIRLADMEPDLIKLFDSDQVLYKKLKKHNYDFILIDPPPSFSKVNTIALFASSAVLIPTELAPYPVRALEYVLNRTFIIADVIDRPIHVLGISVSRYVQNNSNNNFEMKANIFKLLNRIQQRVEILPEKAWTPQLLVVSKATENKCPIQSEIFYNSLTSSGKEAADRVIESYNNLALNIIEQNQKIQNTKNV